MWRLLVLLALGLSATFQVSGLDGSIEDFIASEMPAAGVPGLAYAVVAEGNVASVGAHGVRLIGGDRKVTPDTAFLVGSISKSFTALAVMQLLEAGKIGLDTEVSHYLASFLGQPAGAITIRQLLSHTSGFSTLQGNTLHTDITGEKDELARRVDRLSQVNPVYKPDHRWEYSNANYQILGGLIEVVSGQEYQRYIATNILEPIGMKHSFVADGSIHASMATGHRPWFGTTRPLRENRTERGTAPQGGIIASANDLGRYMQMMMNGQDDVLSAGGKAQMMRPAGDASPSYGFGWFVDSGNRTVGYEGRGIGFETLATMVPTEKKAVVVLVNSGSGLGFGETTPLRNGITARALGFDYDGEGSQWPHKILFIGMVLLPIIFLLGMIWTWFRRTKVRTKAGSGSFDLFSLWFPLLIMFVASWIIFTLVPRLGGPPLGTTLLFQPDIGLVLIATAVFGMLWAVFRLAVAYTGKPSPPDR